MKNHEYVSQALEILKLLGLPKAQQNERSALCLLALVNLSPDKSWHKAENPMIGITPIMEWIREHYNKKYAPNSRETIRRQTMHQFMSAGIVTYNPDKPKRPVNSPHAVYQITTITLDLLRSFGSKRWKSKLHNFLIANPKLTEKYANERKFNRIPVKLPKNKVITFSPGAHSELIRVIIEDFIPNFVPGGTLIYAGDTGEKWGYFDKESLAKLNVVINEHGKMPDVVIYHPKKHWLVLVEAVTTHGPVDGKRHQELRDLFADSPAGLVFVTAFPTRALAARYIVEIAWETEVWVSEAPTHLIHFNGERFLGPY